MDEAIKNCIKKTLNSDLADTVEAYLDNRAALIKSDLAQGKPPTLIIKLIYTLKYWANPLGTYAACLPPEDYIQFKNLITLIKDPQSIKPDHHFDTKELFAIKNAVQNRLGQIADKLTLHYKLTNLQDNLNPVPWTTWWDQKTSYEKERIKQNFKRLSPQDKSFLTKKMQHYKFRDSCLAEPTDHPCWYYLMCQYYCCLPQYQLGFLLAPISPFINSPRPIFAYASYGKTFGSGYPPGTHGGTVSDNVIRGFGFIGAVIAGVGLIAGGLLGALYATKKAFISIKNLLVGNKVLRSLLRLAGIGVGAFAGAHLGVPIGIGLAAMIPGISPGIGGLIGAIATASLCAGIGAAMTKYIAKACSFYFNRNALNPSNPSKYQLTPKQKNNIVQHQLSLQAIEDMMKTIFREKSKLGFASVFFWTPDYRKRKQLNQLLDKVKNIPQELPYPLQIGSLVFDARQQYFDPTIPMYTSSNDYLNPYFGYPQPANNQNFAPSAPPNYESQYSSPNLRPTPVQSPINPELNYNYTESTNVTFKR